MSILTAVNSILGDMEAPYALIQGSFRSIGGLIFDVTVREVHTDEDTITAFPVESGTPVSDHVFANPKLIEIAVASSDATGGPGYVQAVYQQVIALKATREPFDVFTGKRAYRNMLFGNVTVVTDETSEHALFLTCRLQEVIITKTTDLAGSNGKPANAASNSPQGQMGTQSLTTQSGLSGFSTGGPVASTGTSVGPGGLSSGFGNAGGGLSFDSYMNNFGGGSTGSVGAGGIGHA